MARFASLLLAALVAALCAIFAAAGEVIEFPEDTTGVTGLKGDEFITINIFVLKDPADADNFIKYRTMGIEKAQKKFADLCPFSVTYLKQGTYGASDPVQTNDLVYGQVAGIAVFGTGGTVDPQECYETMAAYFVDLPLVAAAGEMVKATARVINADD